jgi:hypothetical protein
MLPERWIHGRFTLCLLSHPRHNVTGTCTMKTKLIAAAVLAAGTTAILLSATTSAEIRKPLYFYCAPHFAKNGTATSYTCTQTFTVRCASGDFASTTPTLTNIGGKKWAISYNCLTPPS